MAGAIRESAVRKVPLSKIKHDLSRFLREAGKQEIVIVRHGRPASVSISFASEETDPSFLRRIERARARLRAGRGVRVEDTDSE